MSIYNYPEYYDIAFRYRDLDVECDFLEKKITLFSRTENSSFLDIACGTGSHLLQLGSRGYQADGFDISSKMIEHGRKKAEAEGISTNLWTDNMATFKTEKKYGTAINLLTGFNYLLSNEAVNSHLICVGNALETGGLYIIELNHPREFLVNKPSKTNSWIETEGDFEIEVDWDNERSSVNIMTHQIVSRPLITIRKPDGDGFTISMMDKYRIFLYQEILLFAENSRMFDPVGVYGSFKLDKDFDNSKDSWRMIFILRKK